MFQQRHLIRSASLGTQRQLSSFHYGTAGSGEKIYLQGSLHADELPGMLVLYHLKHLLAAAEARGDIHGEIVVVPVANPIGLAQTVMHDQMGRFDLASGENFNRLYTDFATLIADELADRLGSDADTNKLLIRAAMHKVHAARQPDSEFASLRHILLGMALDADVVLDLHSELEGVVHLYSEAPCWPQLSSLARYLGAQTVLIAKGSGGASFDEALSGVWWRLDEHFAGRFPIPAACTATTVELRGEADVYHHTALQDAQGIYAWLQLRGVLAGNAPPLPDALCEPTPLAGSETLYAPTAGVLVFLKHIGDLIEAGEVVAEIIDPIEDTAVAVRASVSGCLYARESRRNATLGMALGKIAGKVAFRSGNLLGA